LENVLAAQEGLEGVGAPESMRMQVAVMAVVAEEGEALKAAVSAEVQVAKRRRDQMKEAAVHRAREEKLRAEVVLPAIAALLAGEGEKLDKVACDWICADAVKRIVAGAGDSEVDGKMAVQAAVAKWWRLEASQTEQSVWDTKANQSGVVGGMLAFDPTAKKFDELTKPHVAVAKDFTLRDKPDSNSYVELNGASEDAWILGDPEWAAGVEGGRDVLSKEVLKVDKEEGRVVGLDLSGEKWKGEALPASVARLTALRELKMQNCTSLASITIPASVTQIGEFAFRGCTSLASITIPASVTQIGRCAFFGCTSLASITISASVTQIGESAFRGCTSLASITIPASVTQIGRCAFDGCTSLASITISASVTQIGEAAFRDCTSLASITIPASVTQIVERAFDGCTSLASITIPASVTQIDWGVFRGCTSLASITIPASVTQIGSCAFDGCTSLASITIPASVTQIGDCAFRNCTSLASITIPSVTVFDPSLTFDKHTQVTRAKAGSGAQRQG
jgi:hypothetical protein